MTEPPAEGLPDDAVALLNKLRRLSEDDYGGYPLLGETQRQATELLERYGVRVKSPEEELRDELAEAKRKLADVGRKIEEAKRERTRVVEQNQIYGKQINKLRAELAKAKAESHLRVLAGSQDLIDRISALLKAADIEATVELATKEVSDAPEAATEPGTTQ